MIIDHTHRKWRAKQDGLGKHKYTGAYYYSQEIVQNINANQRQVRYDLGTRVGKQLRIIPELKFYVDDSLDYVEHIDELLKK